MAQPRLYLSSRHVYLQVCGWIDSKAYRYHPTCYMDPQWSHSRSSHHEFPFWTFYVPCQGCHHSQRRMASTRGPPSFTEFIDTSSHSSVLLLYQDARYTCTYRPHPRLRTEEHIHHWTLSKYQWPVTSLPSPWVPQVRWNQSTPPSHLSSFFHGQYNRQPSIEGLSYLCWCSQWSARAFCFP